MDKLKLYNLPLSQNKPLDNMHKRFYESRKKVREEHYKLDFQKWLKYKNHLNKINYLYDSCKEILKKKGYLIVNESKLKDEIASYIYYSSNAIE